MASYSAIQIASSPPKSWRDPSLVQNLRFTTNIPIPVPGPGQVVVNIKAASLNARDLMVTARDPVYPITTIPNLSPCSDCSGIIYAVGEGSEWAGKEGEKVVLCPSVGWKGRDMEEGEVLKMDELGGRGAGDVEGCLREYALVDDEEVLPAPSHLSFEELAALPTAGGTAFNSLFCGPQPLKAGQTVLTQGTGGVSCFAIQLASAAGCTVISTSSSDAKLEIARELGAKHTINYTQTPGWAEEVLNLTRGNGVDHVLDVGGANTILQSLKAVKQGGVVSVVGILGPGDEAGIVAALLFGGKTMRGIFGGNKKVWEGLLKMVGKKEVLPRVEMVLGWGEEEVKGAFELLGRREAVGKIVVRVGGE